MPFPKYLVYYSSAAGNADEYGPVAQLGERSVRIREVEGSSPFRSTRWTLHEHLLLFQRRLCRVGVAVM